MNIGTIDISTLGFTVMKVTGLMDIEKAKEFRFTADNYSHCNLPQLSAFKKSKKTVVVKLFGKFDNEAAFEEKYSQLIEEIIKTVPLAYTHSLSNKSWSWTGFIEKEIDVKYTRGSGAIVFIITLDIELTAEPIYTEV